MQSMQSICRRQLRKSGISGNSHTIPEMPSVSSIAWAFPEMPRQLQKLEINLILFTAFKIWEMAQHKKTRF
jgi:hypothetical protein